MTEQFPVELFGGLRQTPNIQYYEDGTPVDSLINRDAFGYYRVSNKVGEFEFKQIHGRHPTIISERVYGAIIEHGTITGSFNVGDTFEDDEQSTCTITDTGSGFIAYDCIGGNQFTDGGTLTILTGAGAGSTATITSHNTGADLYYDYNRSSTFLKVGTLSGQRVIRQTPYMHYISGDSKVYDITGVFGTIRSNQEAYIIYGDDLNGWGFCTKNGIINIILRSSVSGSIVEELIPQTDWNYDTLINGNQKNPSGIHIDPTKFQITGGDFQWLGGGSRAFFASIGRRNILIHIQHNANINSSVYSKTASLPLRWEIKNTGTTIENTLESVCCAVNNEGGNAIAGLDFVISSGETYKSITVAGTPLLFVRHKNEYPAGEVNRMIAEVFKLAGKCKSNDCKLVLYHGHGLKSVTGTFLDYDIETGLEYSTDVSAVTAVHLHRVGEIELVAGIGGSGGVGQSERKEILTHNKIYQNIESTGGTFFVVYGYADATPCTARCSMAIIAKE